VEEELGGDVVKRIKVAKWLKIIWALGSKRNRKTSSIESCTCYYFDILATNSQNREPSSFALLKMKEKKSVHVQARVAIDARASETLPTSLLRLMFTSRIS